MLYYTGVCRKSILAFFLFFYYLLCYLVNSSFESATSFRLYNFSSISIMLGYITLMSLSGSYASYFSFNSRKLFTLTNKILMFRLWLGFLSNMCDHLRALKYYFAIKANSTPLTAIFSDRSSITFILSSYWRIFFI